MNHKRTIVVFGATGAQGGGLVHAILNDPDHAFTVRAVTRDANSEAARALAARGAEVVTANLDDAASVRKAMEGAYGAYCVTFFWDHFSPAKELAQARTMADAAADAGVQHVIWSTLEDTRELIEADDLRFPTLTDNCKVPHFDAKGAANQFFTNAGVPVTFLLTSFYWDNFINLGMGPRSDEAGRQVLTLPLGTSRLSAIAAEDIGKCAFGIFQAGQSMIGQTIGVAGEQLTGAELAEIYSTVTGEPVTYQDISCETYRELGFPGSDDLANMFCFYQEFEALFCASRNVPLARKLNPGLQTFSRWLESRSAVLT